LPHVRWLPKQFRFTLNSFLNIERIQRFYLRNQFFCAFLCVRMIEQTLRRVTGLLCFLTRLLPSRALICFITPSATSFQIVRLVGTPIAYPYRIKIGASFLLAHVREMLIKSSLR